MNYVGDIVIVLVEPLIKEPVEGILKIRADSVNCFEYPAGDCYLMEVWIVAVFIIFLNE